MSLLPEASLNGIAVGEPVASSPTRTRRWVRTAASPISVFVLLVLAGAPASVFAQSSRNHFILHGDRSDYVTAGQTYRVDCDVGYQFVTYDNDGDGIPEALSLAFGKWDLIVDGNAAGRSLTPGVYENAHYPPSAEEHTPGLSFFGDGRGCSVTSGRFEILDAAYDTSHREPNGHPAVLRFAIRFQQSCGPDPSAPALDALIVYNSDVAVDLDPPVVSNVQVTRARLHRSRGESTTISWSASDNVGVIRYEVRWSPDGTVFESIASGLGPDARSFTWTPPNTTDLTRSGVLEVFAVDENGNAGMAAYAKKIVIKR